MKNSHNHHVFIFFKKEACFKIKIYVGKSIFFIRIEQICLGFILFSLWGNNQDCVSGFFTGFQPEYNATLYLQL